MPTLATNKYVRSDYDLLEEYEAGLVLTGPEVKSAKAGQVNMKGTYISVRGNEMIIRGLHISPYKPAGPRPDYDPTQDRKLLLHTREIKRLIGKSKEGGLTLVPISLYTKGDLVKLSFAVARGRKKYEKREAIKRKEVDREVRRIMKG